MTQVMTTLAILVLAYIAMTFTVGLVKTIREGQAGFDAFDHAGFTLGAFWHGRVPKSGAGSSLSTCDSAEISIVDGIVEAKSTRTISKTLS